LTDTITTPNKERILMKTLNINRTERQSDKAQTTQFSKMEAIALGVQARFEESTGYSKKVTDETIDIARSLGIANSEIERWASHRLNVIARETERLREIKSLLNKAYGMRLSPGTRRIPS
jgi:hypothetical protein